MVHSNNNTSYYINPAYLTFVENSGYGANLIQVSASSSCYIRVFIPGEIGYDSDGNYRRWKIIAYNNRFPDNDAFYIYARLERNGYSALIVYSKVLYNVDGSSVNGSIEASDTYYYIKLGDVTATDGTSIREITYDTGRLESDQVKNEGSELNEMWELDRYSSPWLIKAKQWLSSFTIKGILILIGGLIFKKNEVEKPVVDLKRSMDSDFEYIYNEDGSVKTDENGFPIKDETYVPISDDTIPTTKYVKTMNDDRYILKIRPDQTEFLVKFLDGLEAGLHEDGGVDGSKLYSDGRAELGRLQVNGNSEFRGDLSSKEFISGFTAGKGWAIRLKEYLNSAGVTEHRSVAEFDDLIIRGTLRVFEFVVSQMLGENDNRTFTAMLEVDHYDPETGRVWLDTRDGTFYNPFRKDDVVIVQQFNGMPSEENGYYMTKQYELIVEEVGVGDMSLKEERLDWLTFRDFTSPMEDATTDLIQKGDTFVRIDNLTDPTRKGIIQLMTVGEDTPYMDIIYGRKTDPDNSLKGRFGNIQGVYNPLFGWLREFGAYLTNLYAVGEFRIAHTGEDVADALEISSGQFRTSYSQTTYDMTEADNFFTNASMTNSCESWVLSEEQTEYFTVGDDLEFFNYEPYVNEESFAGISEHKGRDMLRLYKGYVYQTNELIRKPGTHKVYDPNSTGGGYEDVPDTIYLSIRVHVTDSGVFECGFASEDGTFYENPFHVIREYDAQEDAYDIRVSGTWDGLGDFWIKSSGDMYIDMLSLTDDTLDNFKITTSTKIEQDAKHIALIGRKVDGVEGSVTDLKLVVDAQKGEISAVSKKIDQLATDVTQSGFITSDDWAALFSQAEKDGRVVAKSELSTYVQKDGDGYISGVRVKADAIDITGNDVINLINTQGTTTILANRININGWTSINRTFTINEYGYMNCSGGTIGNFTISGGNLVSESYDADILIRNTNSTRMAGIGLETNLLPGHTAIQTIGMFVDEENVGLSKMALAVSAKNGYENIAMYIHGGSVAAFAEKVGSYLSESSISRMDNVAVIGLSNVTFPEMFAYDDGHNLTVVSNLGSNITIKAVGQNFIRDGNSVSVSYTLGAYKTAKFIYVHGFKTTQISQGVTHSGGWIKI